MSFDGVRIISKRKPPSQRPDRQLDDTARAIAKALETARTEKAETKSSNASGPPSLVGRGGKDQGHPPLNRNAPTISTKRPKQP